MPKATCSVRLIAGPWQGRASALRSTPSNPAILSPNLLVPCPGGCHGPPTPYRAPRSARGDRSRDLGRAFGCTVDRWRHARLHRSSESEVARDRHRWGGGRARRLGGRARRNQRHLPPAVHGSRGGRAGLADPGAGHLRTPRSPGESGPHFRRAGRRDRLLARYAKWSRSSRLRPPRDRQRDARSRLDSERDRSLARVARPHRRATIDGRERARRRLRRLVRSRAVLHQVRMFARPLPRPSATRRGRRDARLELVRGLSE